MQVLENQRIPLGQEARSDAAEEESGRFRGFAQSRRFRLRHRQVYIYDLGSSDSAEIFSGAPNFRGRVDADLIDEDRGVLLAGIVGYRDVAVPFQGLRFAKLVRSAEVLVDASDHIPVLRR